MNDSLSAPPRSDSPPAEVSRWDDFWFRPITARPLERLRLLTAAVLFVWFASWIGPGAAWLSADGVVAPATIADLSSYWVQTRLVGNHPYAWLPYLGMAASIIWATGKWTPVPAAISWISLLAIFHRIPVVTGRLEALLAVLCGYLLFAPGGASVSQPRSRTRVVVRLLQLHLSALLVVTGLQQLGGSEVWWNGEAAWWLAASEPRRIVDFTQLHNFGMLFDAATLYGATYPLAAGVLLWSRHRCYVLAAGVPYWLGMGLATGEWLYFALLPLSAWGAFSKAAAGTTSSLRKAEA